MRRTSQAAWSLLLSVVPMMIACSSSVAPDSSSHHELVPDQPAPPATVPAQAILDRTLNPSTRDYGTLYAQDFAEHDYVVMPLRALFSEDGAANVARIRAVNPDVVILGVIQVLAWLEHWDDDFHRSRMTLGAELHDLFHDRPARTTTGAAALMWDRAPMLNPLRDGRLDEAMLDGMIDVIVEHFARYPGVVDGIMHDYTSIAPWIYPSPQEAAIGEIDLDQDGVPFDADPVEQRAWYDWQEQTVVRLQQRLGSGLIQIANGRLPIDHPEFARHLAGVWFQDYPTMPWDVTPRQGFEQLIALVDEHLTPRRGRTWCLLAPPTWWDPGEVAMRRFASLFTGAHYAYMHSDSYVINGDPDAVDYGPPLGPLETERLSDGGLRYSRAFRDGIVALEFGPTGFPRAQQVPPN